MVVVAVAERRLLGQREKESRLNPQTQGFGLIFLLVFPAHREVRPFQEPGRKGLGRRRYTPPPPPAPRPSLQSLSPPLESQSLGKKESRYSTVSQVNQSSEPRSEIKISSCRS